MAWKRATKFDAIITKVDGYTFKSRKEARRYNYLKHLLQLNEISDLKVHPRYEIEIDGKPVLIRSEGFPNGRRTFIELDFEYRECATGELVVEDVKGFDLPMSRLKRAIFEAKFNIRVRII